MGERVINRVQCFMQNLLQVCERIPTIGTQLKILSTVKATMLGAQGKYCLLVCHAPELPPWAPLSPKSQVLSPNMTGVA